MDSVLQVEFSGWTATPRMPFVLSGNAMCLHTPTYSLLLGVVGCCLGRVVNASEVQLGFRYSFDSIAKDLETRQRLQFDGKRIVPHAKGTDAYWREFHISPKLTIWLNRVDWELYFLNPVGTPSLGRSQDILKIESVNKLEVSPVEEGYVSGCMLPFHPNLQVGGQLVQLAEAYRENDEIGSGRTATKTAIFISIPHDNKASVKMPSLYRTNSVPVQHFYLHEFTSLL
jgi:CRISPR-associated protein Cas5t